MEAKTLDRSSGYRPYEATRAFWERNGFVHVDTIDPLPGWEPGNPAADVAGNVKYPNVNPLVEMTDMREAQRSYEANLNIISATRRMIQRTLDILKA